MQNCYEKDGVDVRWKTFGWSNPLNNPFRMQTK